MTSFSQSFSNPKIIADSNGVEMLAFNTQQLDIIKQEILLSGLNKKRIRELNKKINLLLKKNDTYSALSDSLQEQYNTCIQISINKDGMIEVREKQIEDLKNAITDYQDIITNNEIVKENMQVIIDNLKMKIKKKNMTITGLLIIDIIIIILVI